MGTEHKDMSLDSLRQMIFDSHNDIPYLNRVVKECLRLSPAAPSSVTYIINEDMKLDGWLPVKQGDHITVSCLGILSHPEIWPNPMEFRPERFDPESKWWLTKSGKTRHSHSYTTFGHGK